jgi:hypothetical protein
MDDRNESQDRRRTDQRGDDPLFEPIENAIEHRPLPAKRIPVRTGPGSKGAKLSQNYQRLSIRFA